MGLLKGRIVLAIPADAPFITDATGSIGAFGAETVLLTVNTIELPTANDGTLRLRIQQSADNVKFFDIGSELTIKSRKVEIVSVTGIEGSIVRLFARWESDGLAGETCVAEFEIQTAIAPSSTALPRPDTPSMGAMVSLGEIPLVLPARFRPLLLQTMEEAPPPPS